MENDKKIVLAIDDVTLSLLSIKQTLANYVNVYVAKSGSDALKMLNFINVDLFLVDLNMPDMSGLEFLKSLREIEKYKDTPAIVVSGNDKENKIIEATSYGISGYITKPYKQNVLRTKVFQILGISE